MNWKILLTTVIEGTQYEFAVDSAVVGNRWVVKLNKKAGAMQMEEMKLFFNLERCLISYEPVTIVTRKVVSYVTDDLRKLARYW